MRSTWSRWKPPAPRARCRQSFRPLRADCPNKKDPGKKVMTTDRLTLSDAQGHSIEATLLHVYDREELKGVVDRDSLTFRRMAAELFAVRPQASAVALLRAGACPMVL